MSANMKHRGGGSPAHGGSDPGSPDRASKIEENQETRALQQPSSSSKPSASQVVEDIGLGPAQGVLLLLSSGGMSFCDGAEIVALSVVRDQTSAEFDLGANRTACLMTLVSLGILLGTALVGYVGDYIGRRRPIIFSYAIMTTFGFLSSLAPNYASLLVCRALLGVGIGFGMPPAIVLLSETTPERWRICMRAASYIFWNAGGIYASYMAAVALDPNLDGSHWRLLFVLCNLPTLLFFCLSCFLWESPIFLTNTGQLAKAHDVLKRMQNFNRAYDANIESGPGVSNNTDLGNGKEDVSPACFQKLGLIFSEHRWRTTVIVAYACFSVNLMAWGYSWISPYALKKVSTEEGGMAAAWTMVNSSFVGFGIIVILFFIADNLSRKMAMIFSLFLGASASASFAFGGAHSVPRPWVLDVLYYYGINAQTAASTLGYIVIYQVAVEIYPTKAVATGSSFIAGCGRVGSLLAPLMVENVLRLFGDWTWSLYVLCAFSVSGLLLLTLLPPLASHERRTTDSGDPDNRDLYGAISLETKLNASK